ncbi:fibronectin type III domain-containing protein [Saccharibacillus sacchari]|uniref:fibronectin type III domain-containing protein n=1 Tax=Saccharibacillus sacchari TaxID=456493 RepID=UPI0004BB02EB|nr:fibronectin type III domain-containing protein [Saccharibacillus sacchari]
MFFLKGKNLMILSVIFGSIVGMSFSSIHAQEVIEKQDESTEIQQPGNENEIQTDVENGSEIVVAPLEIKAELIDATTVNLFWKAPVHFDELNYEVYQNEKRIGETKELSYTVTALQPGENYVFTLRSISVSAISDFSEPVQIHTYGEVLKNGSFLQFEDGSDLASNWTIEQDEPKAALVFKDISEADQSVKQQVVVAGLEKGKQIRIYQKVALAGNKPYSWSASHAVLNSGSDLKWELLFWDENGQLIGKELLKDSTQRAKPQKGTTPDSTAFASLEFIITGKDSSGAVITLNSASLKTLPENEVTPVKVPKGPATYRYRYDANGRLTLIETELGKMNFKYNANGNLLARIREGFSAIPDSDDSTPPINTDEKLPDIGEITSGSQYQLYGEKGFVSMKGVNMLVKGWYLSEQKVDKVEYYWNEDTLLGESVYGVADEMTYFNHPEYENHNGGFKFIVQAGSLFDTLPEGPHKLSVVFWHHDGSSHTLEQQILLQVSSNHGQ